MDRPRRHRAKALLAACAASFVCSAAGADEPPATLTYEPPRQDATRDIDWLQPLYRRASRAVVLITTEEGVGSGFVFHSPHHVATAFHVVSGARRIELSMPGQATRSARVVAYDVELDLAILQIETPFKDAPVLEPYLDAVDVGQRVAVIGHPFSPYAKQMKPLKGLLNWTLTQGVVGAVSDDWVQTDAAVNPGNSGGPMLAPDGRVIGVVSAHIQAADGIGIAVRARQLVKVALLIGVQEPPPTPSVEAEDGEVAYLHEIGRSVDGFAIGGGVLMRRDFPLRVRLSLGYGDESPGGASVVRHKLRRYELDLDLGYRLLSILSVGLGGALLVDHTSDTTLRIVADAACVAPCVGTPRFEQSADTEWRLLPSAWATLDLGVLRLGFAQQFDLGRGKDSIQRFTIGLLF